MPKAVVATAMRFPVIPQHIAAKQAAINASLCALPASSRINHGFQR